MTCGIPCPKIGGLETIIGLLELTRVLRQKSFAFGHMRLIHTLDRVFTQSAVKQDVKLLKYSIY